MQRSGKGNEEIDVQNKLTNYVDINIFGHSLPVSLFTSARTLQANNSIVRN
jgi:hypothetical protein